MTGRHLAGIEVPSAAMLDVAGLMPPLLPPPPGLAASSFR